MSSERIVKGRYKMDDENDNMSDSRHILIGFLTILSGIFFLLYSIAWPIYLVSNKIQYIVYGDSTALFLGLFLPILGLSMVVFKRKIWDCFPTENGDTVSVLQIIGIVILVVVIVYFQSLILEYLSSIGYADFDNPFNNI